MRKFFREFREFINRGNILDLSVAVIIGGAFSTIVTTLTNKVIMPLINLLLSAGGNGLESAYTMLKPVYYIEGDPSSGIDLTKSIYIDWGAFITAIINFILIALVIFIIMKVVNSSAKKIQEINKNIKKEVKKEVIEEKKEARAKAKAEGRKYKEVWAEHLAEKKAEAEEQARIEAEAKAKAEEEERLANPTEQELLKQIRDLLANKE